MMLSPWAPSNLNVSMSPTKSIAHMTITICSSVYRLFRMISSRVEEPIFWESVAR
jgi:hypothetical protein